MFCFRLNVFVSKITNLPLSLGTEGQGPKNYPIYTQYIYDVFLLTYLSIFALAAAAVVVVVVVVDFPLFGASKDLIRDSQRL